MQNKSKEKVQFIPEDYSIDVQNDFGNTTLVVHQPLSATPHRLSSVSGRVEVNTDPAALGDLPVLVATSYGTIRTNTGSDAFPQFHMGQGFPPRNWRGFRRVLGKTPGGGEPQPVDDIFGLIAVLQGSTNPPGLVVISQAGAVVFNLGNAP